ncbi:6-pyruvoyl tetrahydropterin synthase [Botrimarina colliarenosi]|uniref:6-carboxy-5,6,7,8-tetrahydropterin synthase n=1 Tax=Botrimarina colliarenosi TaxID=2528001 RepID=A0A5C6AGY7_9BACT|nr:6-pyruvoyl tetrahydropterin synthase family protein [Botrimarina colliarenosi]TWT99244.1 6-pyruvoyl tetrahydropterin synthase [Botrimarina colliarenosi]
MAGPSSRNATFAIRLNKAAFTFSAAHFITYAGDVCEPLHGHNYRVAIEADGVLDENAYVLDFIATRDALSAITTELDHRMLLPTGHPLIGVEEATGPLGGDELVVTFGDRRWVFPKGECVRLPVTNTTAELLARWIGERLLVALAERGETPPTRLVVEVDECDGQVGVCRLGRS